MNLEHFTVLFTNPSAPDEILPMIIILTFRKGLDWFILSELTNLERISFEWELNVIWILFGLSWTVNY